MRLEAMNEMNETFNERYTCTSGVGSTLQENPGSAIENTLLLELERLLSKHFS